MKIYTLFFALSFLPCLAIAQNCTGGGAPSTAVLDLTGRISFDEYTDADNQKGTLTTTAGDVVGVRFTGVQLATVTGSYCSEAEIDLSVGATGVYSNFSNINNTGPCGTITSFFDLANLNIEFATAGSTVWELYESFDDNPDAADANFTAGTVTIYVCPTGQALPIILNSFYGKTVDRGNILHWETAAEKNVQYHVLERSSNAIQWHEIGRQDGKIDSHSATSYAMEDNTPMRKSYYRLRVIDYNGEESVSDIVVLNQNSNALVIDHIYPAPARDYATLEFTSQSNVDVHIRLTDLAGRLLQDQVIEAVGGENITTLDLTTLPSGMYMVSIVGAAETSMPIRFVKQ